MSQRDFRDFIAIAEQRGRVRRVTKQVDRLWEPACFAKWAFQALPDETRFGFVFDDVEGSDFSLATGVLGNSRESYAMALGVEPDEITEKWLDALRNPIAPRTVDSAPCQEVVRLGKDAKLSDLPIPVWTPGKDAAPYITTIVINAHHDTGAQNMGVYRTMVRDDHHVVSNLNPGRQGFEYCKTWFAQGKPAPIAWVVAAEPVVHLATVLNMPQGVDEVTVAGGLKGAPVDMVKAKTSDLLVPARAEMIIEGEVLPDEYGDEGPFGEFAGYMGPVAPKPLVRITAITHRKDAIYYGITSQMPPSESTMLQSLGNAPLLLKQLRDDMGEAGVHDVFIDLTFGGLLAHGIIAITPRRPGDPKRIGRLIASTTPLKRITIVDDYVDVRDPLHVEWAMNSHYNPVRDTEIVGDVYFPMGMDPSVRVTPQATEMGSKVILDATQTIDAGEFSLPKRAIMEKALESWKSAGLPDFDIPKRAKLRIEQS